MSKPTVALLTFFYAHNYGAVLQAYALKRRIELMGYDVIVANYQNETVASGYKKKLRINLIRKHWLNPENWHELYNAIRFHSLVQKDWDRQWQCFENFTEQHFEKNKLLNFDEVSKLDVDFFIVGSDQVWERSITKGFDRVYFLDFDTTAKKVSYAASMARWPLNNQDQQELKSLLGNFAAISVREEQIAHELENLLGGSVATVLDPSMLLDIDEYAPLETTKILERDRFVFTYFVSECDDLMRCAQKVADELKCKLIELHYFRQPLLKEHNQVADIGPAEFLWYIAHSEAVVTNSFHGVCFAIIFKKPFYAVYKKGHNVRVQDLLSRLGLEHRHVESAAGITSDDEIDYAAVYMRLKDWRERSVGFLAAAIGGSK